MSTSRYIDILIWIHVLQVFIWGLLWKHIYHAWIRALLWKHRLFCGNKDIFTDYGSGNKGSFARYESLTPPQFRVIVVPVSLLVMSAASPCLRVCVTWLLIICDTILLHMCDLSRSHAWHDFTCTVSCFTVSVCTCDVTPLCGVTWLSFICVTWQVECMTWLYL